jgi:hypothetical protein
MNVKGQALNSMQTEEDSTKSIPTDTEIGSIGILHQHVRRERYKNSVI